MVSMLGTRLVVRLGISVPAYLRGFVCTSVRNSMRVKYCIS